MAPPSKKPKLEQKFRPEYTSTWASIVRSKLSDGHARCTTCETDFTIKSGGASDIERHVKTKKHQEADKLRSKNNTVTSYFASTSNPLDEKVMNAEMLWNKFLVEHNLPIAASDHAGPLFKAMFPDSEVAKRFSCGRSKATAINHCLANEISADIVQNMKKNPFSISTDGSNDGGEGQLYPIVVRTFDEEEGKVMTDMVCLKTCEGSSTGENIFKVLDSALKENEVEWGNCLAFACDNASVMTGSNKGVSAFILKENSNVYINGCPCHLLHIAAKTATKELSADVEEQLVDIFFYLDKSSKRKKEFISFQQQCGTSLHAIIKHGATRWLSLQSCVERLIEQWEPLQEFFKADLNALSSKEKDTSKHARLVRVNKFFGNPGSKLYCLFLMENLSVFTSANLMLQKESPQIHRLMGRLDELVTDLIVRFIRSSAIHNSKSIFEVDFNDKKNQLTRKDLVLGSATREYFQLLQKDPSFTSHQEDLFVKEVKAFYCSALKYVIDKFPLQDEFLANAAVIDVSRRLSTKYSMLEYFVRKFPCLLPEEDVKNLHLEFNKFQAEPLSNEIMDEERVDVQWFKIGQITNMDKVLKFPTLSRVMKGLCCLTHSNADTERVFSLVRKNKTDFRATLSTKTLSSLLIQKVHMLSRGTSCYQHSFSSALKKKAKKAYSQSLESSK